MFTFVIPISFSNSCRYILSQAVIEKETKMKESLKIMSLKTPAYGLSFFLSQAVFSTFTSIIITATFVYMNFVPVAYMFQFFIVTFMFGLALISYSLVVTTFFSDSKLSI